MADRKTILGPDQTVLALFRSSMGALDSGGAADNDELVFLNINSAIGAAKRAIRVPLVPTHFIPEGDQTIVDSLPENTVWEEEPGYDFEGDMFVGRRWGAMMLRHRPVIEIKKMVFSYPYNQDQLLFEVPQDWIKIDKKYAHLNLVPATGLFLAPLSAYIMQMMGGHGIPHMVHIHYVAGLKDIHADYPDLVDAIYKLAVVKLMLGILPSASTSINTDGFSQSDSFGGDTIERYSKMTHETFARIRDSLYGIRLLVV